MMSTYQEQQPTNKTMGTGREDDLPAQNFEDKLFDMLISGDSEKVAVTDLFSHLRSVGLWRNDPRLRDTMERVQLYQEALLEEGRLQAGDTMLDRDTFKRCIHGDVTLIQRAFTTDLVIPEFKDFASLIDDIYLQCKANRTGQVASYIPQLSRYSPEYWGVSLCTVDGQRHSVGDVTVPFPVQSSSKPICYALALNEHGEQKVHKHVGHEPSGESFNHIKLGHGNKPHNPMINAGAILVSSMLGNNLCLADRFDYVSNQYRAIAGGDYLGFNNAVFLSERENADRNFSLAYYMKENKCFPEGFNLQETMDFYFQLCSIEINCESGAVMAATLANGGICPTTGQQVLNLDAVRNTLSLMHSCGMYDYSGEFAFKCGLPAKSGVSGVILLVIPNVAGMCLWSPPIDQYGNSARAVQFCQSLVETFNFHHYDNLTHTPTKLDPRVRPWDVDGAHIVKLLCAATNGDLTALRRMALAGRNMSVADYDGRTALHLAAAEGQLQCVKFLLEKCNVHPNPKDRWGHTPVDDAVQFDRLNVARYLRPLIRLNSGGIALEKYGIMSNSTNQDDASPNARDSVWGERSVATDSGSPGVRLMKEFTFVTCGDKGLGDDGDNDGDGCNHRGDNVDGKEERQMEPIEDETKKWTEEETCDIEENV